MEEKSYKIVVLGAGAVGKTSVISRFWKDEFSENAEPTIGVDFAHKEIEYQDASIQTQIWDTAGQERFRAVAAPYFRGAHGAILVYDVTSQESFSKMDDWKKELREYRDEEDCLLMILGNKKDLDNKREVPLSQGQEYGKSVGKNSLIFETSAKTGEGVNDSFMTFIKHIHDYFVEKGDDDDSEEGNTRKPDPNQNSRKDGNKKDCNIY